MSIEARLAKLEARATTRATAPTQAEAAAAYERVVLEVRANFIARVTDAPLPPESEEYARDLETVQRYRTLKGFIVTDPNIRERLKARLGRLRAAELAGGEGTPHRSG